MADVTVMHSVVIKATGSTATDTGVFLELIMSPLSSEAFKLSLLFFIVEDESRPRIDGAGESVFGPSAFEVTAGASLLILSSIRAQHRCHVEYYGLGRPVLELRQFTDID
jgi:hypothetical protein